MKAAIDVECANEGPVSDPEIEDLTYNRAVGFQKVDDVPALLVTAVTKHLTWIKGTTNKSAVAQSVGIIIKSLAPDAKIGGFSIRVSRAVIYAALFLTTEASQFVFVDADPIEQIVDADFDACDGDVASLLTALGEDTDSAALVIRDAAVRVACNFSLLVAENNGAVQTFRDGEDRPLKRQETAEQTRKVLNHGAAAFGTMPMTVARPDSLARCTLPSVRLAAYFLAVAAVRGRTIGGMKTWWAGVKAEADRVPWENQTLMVPYEQVDVIPALRLARLMINEATHHGIELNFDRFTAGTMADRFKYLEQLFDVSLEGPLSGPFASLCPLVASAGKYMTQMKDIPEWVWKSHPYSPTRDYTPESFEQQVKPIALLVGMCYSACTGYATHLASSGASRSGLSRRGGHALEKFDFLSAPFFNSRNSPFPILPAITSVALNVARGFDRIIQKTDWDIEPMKLCPDFSTITDLKMEAMVLDARAYAQSVPHAVTTTTTDPLALGALPMGAHGGVPLPGGPGAAAGVVPKNK